jgi:hypothetical protein
MPPLTMKVKTRTRTGFNRSGKCVIEGRPDACRRIIESFGIVGFEIVW